MNRLINIGTGSGLPQKGKGGPSHLVEVEDNVLLLDCGEGSAGYLRALNRLLSVDWIILTHLHSDHISGLMMFIQSSLLEHRDRLLDIFLPVEGIEPFKIFLNSVYLNQKDLEQESLFIHLKPLTTGIVIETDNMIVHAWSSDHFAHDRLIGRSQRSAYGITIESGNRRLIYTGDISTVGCFVDELRQNCTLLCEAMHIEWDEVNQVVRKRGSKQVIFTHVDPSRSDELKRFCKNKPDLFAATDGMEFLW